MGDSGGHFNPAVSLAATLIGGLNLTMLLPYWISQLCGGLIGAALAKVGDHPGVWAAGFGPDGASGVEGRVGVYSSFLFPPLGLGGPFLLGRGPSKGLCFPPNPPCSVCVWTQPFPGQTRKQNSRLEVSLPESISGFGYF